METDVGVFAWHSLSDMGVRSPHVEILIQNVNKRRSQLSTWDSVKKCKLGIFIQMKKMCADQTQLLDYIFKFFVLNAKKKLT